MGRPPLARTEMNDNLRIDRAGRPVEQSASTWRIHAHLIRRLAKRIRYDPAEASCTNAGCERVRYIDLSPTDFGRFQVCVGLLDRLDDSLFQHLQILVTRLGE